MLSLHLPKLPMSLSIITIPSSNISCRRQILIELYENPIKELSFDNLELPNTINDIALVEVKKINEGKKRSKDKEIWKYAEKDFGFLREQIGLINPNIILCCYTHDSYADFLYTIDYDLLAPLSSDSNCKCYKDANRLIIDFYHPSNLYFSQEELFDILCKIIREGKVFKNFDWGKQ